MNFIKKLNITANIQQMKSDLDHFIANAGGWPVEDFVNKSSGNQLGLNFRPNAKNIWTDASGSLYNKDTGEELGKETDFTQINPAVPDYTKKTLELLSEHVGAKFGRIRYMRLMPKTGLSIHADAEERYHFVLDTNPYALFGRYTGGSETVADCYHIPMDGYFYKVDTKQRHFVFNGGWEPRIHLVICET